MKPKIIPVIHYADDEQAKRNAAVAHAAGCAGVFLIHMDGQNHLLAPVAKTIKAKWPDLLVGTNLLGVDPFHALTANIAHGFDMTWTDEQITHSDLATHDTAERMRGMMQAAPDHLVFAAVAFKYQRPEPMPATAARTALSYGFIPTTSGSGTGVAASIGTVAVLHREIGEDAPLAIASGIDLGNAAAFAPLLSHILVATGVSRTFHEIDPDKLAELCRICA